MPAGTLEQRRRVEFGDFQTPSALAEAVCRVLAAARPATLIEPTCGAGAFVAAALDCFPQLRVALGFDVNPRYVAAARRLVARSSASAVCRLRVANFFQVDWPAVIAACAGPALILGNPPWVTNSALGAFGGVNLPPKQNLPGRSGLEGLTGKSNFDVSEWMIWRLLEAMVGRPATLALLCKTAVARRVLARASEQHLPIGPCEIRSIDALQHFGARVEACLFVCHTGTGDAGPADCRVYDALDGPRSQRTIGWREGRLVADVAAYSRVRHLLGGNARWRSGVKHDCAAVFEFREDPDGTLVNGLGEAVDLEPDYLFPLLKSADVAPTKARSKTLSHSDGRGQGEGSSCLLPAGGVPRRVLIPQRRVGEDTGSIAQRAPKTWAYLQRHAERLDRRASRVYRDQPRFSIFGVGPYTFAPWKVVVSGFHKTPAFAAAGPVGGRPVLCDDTCYFLPCETAGEARSLAGRLNGPRAREFFQAFIFFDAKRPLTAEILGSLDLAALPSDAQTRPR
jgi:hypothetical protein